MHRSSLRRSGAAALLAGGAAVAIAASAGGATSHPAITAKGVGETATFGVSPAIANAIHDAIGVRIKELPLNPEAVFEAIRSC